MVIQYAKKIEEPLAEHVMACLNTPLMYERDFSSIKAVVDSFRESCDLINDTTKMIIQIESNEHGEKY